MHELSRAIVVGAGIGGLSTAVALSRAGIGVTVLEQAPELLTVGAGIQIWANGVSALHRLGFADRLDDLGAPIERQILRSWRGTTLVEVPIADIARKHGIAPPFCAGRADLVNLLAAALPEGLVRRAARCVGFDQDADGVIARLEGGGEEHGAILIAADGIDSTIRPALDPATATRFAGYQYLRAVTAFDDPALPANELLLLLGPGDRFISHDLGGGHVYWAAVLVARPGTNDAASGRKRELLERFRRFPPLVTAMIEATEEEAVSRTDIRDLPPLDRWGNGRATLLGDAAHATTPNMGRGASEAIEDALALARHLSDAGGLESALTVDALRGYEAERRPKTADVQARARRIGRVLSWRNPIAWRVRERLMRTVAGRGMVKGTDAEFAELAELAGADGPPS